MTSSNNAKKIFDSSMLSRLIKPSLLGTALVTSGLLTACSSSETDNTENVQAEASAEQSQAQDDASAEDEGTLVLAITDAEEDFVSYTIGVKSILLTRENGDQVEVLSDATEVDFVEYQELSELFSVGRLPVGRYQSISMELDYSEAYILIQDENGQTYEAQAMDESGEILTTHLVQFNLTDDQPLIISNKKISHLTLDLDLSSSNTIESYEPAIVKVEPFVVATVDLDEEREHRLRGTVAGADLDAQTLTLNVKPMRKRGGDFGELVVHFDQDSKLEVDGEAMATEAALAFLAEQGEDFPVVVFGTVVTAEEAGQNTFTATQLFAGTSVPWSGKDVFKGLVTKLESGVTYVSGLTIDTDIPQRAHVKDVTLMLDDSTTYANRGDNFTDASFLVPGQRVEALGQFSQSEALSSFNVSGETVRILMSTILGQVAEIDEAGLLTLDVERFNQRPGKMIKRHSTMMEFDSLMIDTSGLTQVDVDTGDWVKVVGYFNPIVDGEEQADLNASGLVKYEVSESELKYSGHWGAEGDAPQISEDNASMVIDMEQGRHKMNFRFNPVNVMPDIASLTLVTEEDEGKFALRERGEQTLFFTSLAELLTSLKPKLEQGTVSSIQAKGSLSEDNLELAVTHLVVKLN